MDSHDVARGRGTAKQYIVLISLFSSLASTVISIPSKNNRITELIQNATFERYIKIWTHAFLIEFEQINNALTSFQNRLSKSSSDILKHV